MFEIKGYTCSCCGVYHDELPTSFGNPAPVYYDIASPEDQNKRFELGEELCIMDNEYYFIRGCIEIPIIDTDEHLIWGVWVSLSEANFNKTKEFWDNQELLEPMYGWLSTSLPCYPDTVSLKAFVHLRGNGLRPYIELEPTDHPLAVESKIGVTYERVQQIAEELCSNNEQ
ncbi:DUF2199 domain-containing protein [Paenibacillus sp. sptzw28]|uniref:DUF2199 domain-containing protein n=1 Tax=Paenibacillus sp. sptzw28 TaxID=715179 RepID=UPI001C6F205B|nr:DUF2199 domain-containing protein [Paenibacillus sp. sptzw28]QYR24111.1 DUF2199 domain-containing protein [Paenibacillus sp. sptzw28]